MRRSVVIMMADCFRMAEQLPHFETLANSMRTSANGLVTAAMVLEKMQNLPVVNVAAQLAQLLREMLGLRADFLRRYSHFMCLACL